MKRILWLCVPLAMVAVACGANTNKSCEKTGCSAGSTCNTSTGQCDVNAVGGGGGTTGGGGGSTGGGGGTTDGGTGGGGGGGATGGGGGGGGSVVDPLDDGGVFLPGAICSKAIPVTFTGTTATVMVDLADAGNDYDPACISSDGSDDLVFAVTLTDAKKLTVTATNTATDSQDPVLSIVRDPCPTQVSVACSDDSGSSTPETLTAPRLTAGTWYVILDNYSSSSTSGTYSVQFDLADPDMVAANDTCSAPTTLVPNMTQMVNLAGTLADATYACAPVKTGDVVFTFTTTQAQKVSVSLDGTVDSNDGVLLLKSGNCTTGPTLACLDAEGSATVEKITYNSLPAGTYYVFVAGYSVGADTYGVSLTLDPAVPAPANDTCTAPELVTLTGGTATVTAALENANHDYTSPDPTCADGSAGNDLVYQVEIPAGLTLTVVATPTASDPVLFASTGTCFGATLTCADGSGAGSTEDIVVPNMGTSPLTAYIIVKSYDANAEPVTLTFTTM